jgi:hypothetical protein
LVLQADPEELPYPGRQIEGGDVAGHAEQLQAEEWHDVADDDPDQEGLGRDARCSASLRIGRSTELVEQRLRLFEIRRVLAAAPHVAPRRLKRDFSAAC